MSKRINTYDDLLAEKERLKALLQAQKELVRQDIEEIKQELAPVKSAISLVGKFVTRDKTNPILTTAAESAIDLVVRKFILSRAGWLTKLAIPFLMKNFSSHILADNKDKLLARLFSFFSGEKKTGGEQETAAPNGKPDTEQPEEPVEEKAI